MFDLWILVTFSYITHLTYASEIKAWLIVTPKPNMTFCLVMFFNRTQLISESLIDLVFLVLFIFPPLFEVSSMCLTFISLFQDCLQETVPFVCYAHAFDLLLYLKKDYEPY